MKQDNKMSSNNDFVSKKLRIEVQILQQQQQEQQQQKKAFVEKKRILNIETKNEKTMKKDVKSLKTLKTLRKYFSNRSIATLKNKEIAKKFITKSNRNINDAEKKDEL